MAITNLTRYRADKSIEELFTELEERLRARRYETRDLPQIRESVRRLDRHLYDATTMPDLVAILRKQLKIDTENRKLRSTAKASKVSHTHLNNFRDGAPVCMEIMNRLANHYPFSYVISNYDPDSVNGAVWLVDKDP